MEPTQLDLDTFNTFEAAYTWVGLSAAEVAPILAALGGPSTFREVGAIPADVYSSVVNDITVPVPGEVDKAPLAPRLIRLGPGGPQRLPCKVLDPWSDTGSPVTDRAQCKHKDVHLS